MEQETKTKCIMIKLYPGQNMTMSIYPRQLYRALPHFSSLREHGQGSLLCPGDHVMKRKPSTWVKPSIDLTDLLERRGLTGKCFWKDKSLLFREKLSGSRYITEQSESHSSWSPGCLCPGEKGKLNL